MAELKATEGQGSQCLPLHRMISALMEALILELEFEIHSVVFLILVNDE